MLTEKEQRLYDTMKDFIYYENRAEEIRSRLGRCSYKITASFSPTGGTGGNGFSSKVENIAIRELQLLGELAEVEKTMGSVLKAVKAAQLTKTERKLAKWIMDGQSLASFARRCGLYSSYVYKIRDKMLKKAAKFL